MTDAAILYLASASPRRRELLEQIGVRYRQLAVAVDESHRPGESPGEYVRRVATEKALAARDALPAPGPVLAADTAVVLDGEILGKPEHAAHADAMLARLSGRRHLVYTGMALAAERCRTRVSVSEVHLRAIGERERAAYIATGEPMDKAGAYAIQGRAAIFVERLEGSYSGVMGLAIFDVAALLTESGFPLWPPQPA